MYGRRVLKTDVRVEAYGTVDELNSALGLVRATSYEPLVQEVILTVQKHLVTLMGELAVDDSDRERFQKDRYGSVAVEQVGWLSEVVIDLEGTHQISFKRWATPGYNLPSAALDIARTICRRAERRVIALREGGGYVNPETIKYLNRLSDVLWLFARYVETRAEGA